MKLICCPIFFLLILFSLQSCNNSSIKALQKAKAVELAADDKGYHVKIGEKAPDFEMTLADGTTTSMEELKGKVVMLQFTASWCVVCRQEMPHIEKEIWQAHQNKDLVVIGIDRDEPLGTVQKFADQMKITYPLALDPNADIFGLFASKKSGVTRNVVVDKKGNIAFLTRLYNEKEFGEMKTVIESLLK
ncbi:MAG: TlpA disulfide reductase family protein [Chitinophagales bacterium]